MDASFHFGASTVREMGRGPAYFNSLTESFDRATATAGLLERDLSIGPASVRLRFAGGALVERLLPAMAHLLTGGLDYPDLTLSIWDTRSTGVGVPPFPWLPRDLRQRGEVAGFNDGRLRTVYHGDITDPNLGFNALSMFDAETATGVCWVESVDRLPWTEIAEPLRPLLHWGLMTDSRHLVHAGAVANGDGGALIVGSGGSGKSTSALACVEAGFRFLSDNYVLMTGGRRPHAHSVFCTAKIRQQGIGFHPGVEDKARKVDPCSDEKYVLDLNRHMPERLVRSAPIEAVFVPRLSDSGRVAATPASPTECLLALAPSTIYQLPSGHRTSLGPMSDLVKSVPTYVLDLGGPPQQVPAVIAAVLAGHGAG